MRATTRPKHNTWGLCQASIIDIGTRSRVGRPSKRGSIPRMGKRFCLLPNVQTGSRTHQVSYSKGNGRSFPWVKEARSSRWPDHSNPYSSEITFLSIYTSIIFFTTGCLILSISNTRRLLYVNVATNCLLLPVRNTSCLSHANAAACYPLLTIPHTYYIIPLVTVATAHPKTKSCDVKLLIRKKLHFRNSGTYSPCRNYAIRTKTLRRDTVHQDLHLWIYTFRLHSVQQPTLIRGITTTLSHTAVVGSNTTQTWMHLCVSCVFVLRVRIGLATYQRSVRRALLIGL
jgi:hypothetical protein